MPAPVAVGVDIGTPGGDKTVEVEVHVLGNGNMVVTDVREHAPRPKRKYTRKAVPAPAVEQLAQAPVAPPAPPAPQLVDSRLARLASVLRELTRDGRMRVSMLDLMRSLGAANYDEAASLVLAAGLRTSQLSGPVQTVLVDHNMRQLLGQAATEVRQ